jgi:Uri superfamily endonuclease
VFAVDDGKWECQLASEIAKKGVEIRSFGCSDCKCSSHLFQFNEIEKAKKTCVNAFKIIKLEPKRLEDLELKN